MSFLKKVPEWFAKGTEPPASLKSKGFEVGYKPPAAIFNWFWNGVSEALEELQGMKPEDIGAAKDRHSASHSENGSDPIEPYNIGAIDARMGLINGVDYTFDTALKQGEYNVQATDVAGAPYTGTLYGKLIVILNDGKEKTDTNWIWQEFLPASVSKQRCWRMKINTDDWTEWFVHYDTGHKPTLSELGAAAENHKHPYTINIGYDRTDIASGSDLNNILNMGCYRCTTATKAASLINCPTKNAFIMDMVAATGGNLVINPNGYTYAVQRIYDLDGKQYTRQVTSNSNGTITYGAWITVYTTAYKPTPAEIGAASTAEMQKRDRVSSLLVNGYFLNPVNQRGYTSYKVKGYTIDMWRTLTDAGTVMVTSGGIQLQSGVALRQYVDVKTSDVLTVAVCDSGGNVYVASGKLSDGTIKATKAHLALDGDKPYFILYENNTFRWAALYKGEYTKDTLPEFVPNGYAAELLECQRYYIRIDSRHIAGQMLSNGGRFGFTLPTAMRITPTLSLVTNGTIICNGVKDVAVTGATLNVIKGNRIAVYTSHESQSGWSLQTGIWLDGSFELSAEL